MDPIWNCGETDGEPAGHQLLVQLGLVVGVGGGAVEPAVGEGPPAGGRTGEDAAEQDSQHCTAMSAHRTQLG